jgi:hypothetical protein
MVNLAKVLRVEGGACVREGVLAFGLVYDGAPFNEAAK